MNKKGKTKFLACELRVAVGEWKFCTGFVWFLCFDGVFFDFELRISECWLGMQECRLSVWIGIEVEYNCDHELYEFDTN